MINQWALVEDISCDRQNLAACIMTGEDVLDMYAGDPVSL